MKTLRHLLLAGLFALVPFFAVISADLPTQSKIAVVNFKTCVDQSKFGKEEQSGFEALRRQIENVLEEREKVMTDMANKLNDADYLDSLSPEAETDLKRKSRALSQELNAIQGQYYQTLSQANMRIIQSMQEAVVKASKTVAENKNIDIVLNEESTFFYNSKYDISQEVIVEMDKNYDLELKEQTESNDK